jgi:hypothetical protein
MLSWCETNVVRWSCYTYILDGGVFINDFMFMHCEMMKCLRHTCCQRKLSKIKEQNMMVKSIQIIVAKTAYYDYKIW